MTSQWFPLHCHSHLSLLDGLSKPDQIASRLIECGHGGSALTDHGTISGAYSYIKAVKDTCQCGHLDKAHVNKKGKCVKAGCSCECFRKNTLKPILGSEFYLCQKDPKDKSKDNGQLSHLCVLAKNKEGWQNLIRATNLSNHPDHFYKKPRLDLETLGKCSGGQWVVFSGHPGSDLANVIFTDWRQAYGAATYEEARRFVRDDWKDAVLRLAGKYQECFGKENFFFECQLIDHKLIPASLVVTRILRSLGQKNNIPCVATADSHYPRQEDARDQLVLLSSCLGIPIAEARHRIDQGEDVGLAGFFRSKRYHIPTSAEMEELHTPEELQNSLKIAEMCENYDILGKPILPHFDCPQGLTPAAYLRQLCQQGWGKKILSRLQDGMVTGWAGAVNPLYMPADKHPLSEYEQRLTQELGVIEEAGLPSYFLIVQDFCDYARSQGWKVGKGRGSAAGCLISYLLGITNVDPIVYGLYFERFYNAGRNAPGRVAFPDIDVDFEKYHREDVVAYCKNKYGADKVAQMATFSRMQGRGALKDVFRANGSVSHEEANRITEYIPEEASVSDVLQEMMEETGEASIIRWALEYEADHLKEWVKQNPDGSLTGPLAQDFEQAIRLEGTFRSTGKHASGLIISPIDLASSVPMFFDKNSGENIVGVDKRDAEAIGLVKFDILANIALDKIRGWENSMRTGKVA